MRYVAQIGIRAFPETEEDRRELAEKYGKRDGVEVGRRVEVGTFPTLPAATAAVTAIMKGGESDG
jgi:hypothetical protein